MHVLIIYVQTGDLLKDWRRLNVALTRAKRKLIVFGSRSTLQQTALLRSFLQLVEDKGWVSVSILDVSRMTRTNKKYRSIRLPKTRNGCTTYHRLPINLHAREVPRCIPRRTNLFLKTATFFEMCTITYDGVLHLRLSSIYPFALTMCTNPTLFLFVSIQLLHSLYIRNHFLTYKPSHSSNAHRL